MRDIKFRAWVKADNKMIYGKSAMSVRTFTNSYAYLESEVEVMQFTGLKDKNSKNIYEGDFVTNKTKNFTGNGFRGKGLSMLVEWDEGECFYSLSVYDGEYFGFKKLTKSSASDIEVIGNIYENPELLKGDTQ